MDGMESRTSAGYSSAKPGLGCYERSQWERLCKTRMRLGRWLSSQS